MDLLVKRLGEIAQRRQCCIELSHHVRKPSMGQAEITVYDARGAGAIVNAVRSCRVLNQMSILEAQQAEIDAEQRGYFIRVDFGKRNMAPPEKARWRKLVSVEIANGDNVQAIEPYDYPKVFSKLTTARCRVGQGPACRAQLSRRSALRAIGSACRSPSVSAAMQQQGRRQMGELRA